MRLIVEHEGERIVRRPNAIRCRYILENGQLLTVYFARYRNRGQVASTIRNVWVVGVHIGKGRREANRWYRSGGRDNTQRQTGACGLEGLAVAGRYIRAFAQHFIGAYDELQIGWADAKRQRAYRYLLRYPGFAMQEGTDGREVCIAYRNPEFYKWNKKEDIGEAQANV